MQVRGERQREYSAAAGSRSGSVQTDEEELLLLYINKLPICILLRQLEPQNLDSQQQTISPFILMSLNKIQLCESNGRCSGSGPVKAGSGSTRTASIRRMVAASCFSRTTSQIYYGMEAKI